NCIVAVNKDEFKYFTVLSKKNNKVIFYPEDQLGLHSNSASISQKSFSPDNKFLAVGSNEIDLMRYKDKPYSIIIIDCEKETVKGYNPKPLKKLNPSMRYIYSDWMIWEKNS